MFHNSSFRPSSWGSSRRYSNPNFWDSGRMHDFNNYYQEFRHQFGVDNLENEFGGEGTWWGWQGGAYPNGGNPWGDDNQFRYDYLDDIRAYFCNSNGANLYDSWGSRASGGMFDMPGWAGYGAQRAPGTPPGRCKYNIGDGRHCPETIRNPYSRYCDFHTFAFGGDSPYDMPSGPSRNSRRRSRRSGLGAGLRDRYSRSTQWADQDPRSAAYEAAMADLQNLQRERRRRESSGYYDGSDYSHSNGEYGSSFSRYQQEAWIHIRELDIDNWPQTTHMLSWLRFFCFRTIIGIISIIFLAEFMVPTTIRRYAIGLGTGSKNIPLAFSLRATFLLAYTNRGTSPGLLLLPKTNGQSCSHLPRRSAAVLDVFTWHYATHRKSSTRILFDMFGRI
ncbi:hypothetical protein ABW20_dc0102043 [Dactylellina cionopaga]|nr:hypothetical protein ABW20_dc0102043 [Dactylellina cionopaga]